MDIRCPKCGEPWDMDCLHDEVAARWPEQPWRVDGKYDQALYQPRYDEVRTDFYARGCAALDSSYGPGVTCTKVTNTSTAAINAAYELCGSDVDGAAAMIEDAETMGLF